MILTVVLIAIGIGAAVLATTYPISQSLANKHAKDTEAVLVQARDALIGRAASDANRPGSLPCPDVDNDGILTLNVDYFSGGVCASLIGRLPWRTLGLPDLRDEAGERLWYALSDLFSDNTTVGPINSDTKGNRVVYGGTTATTITAEAAAVIFAPGPAVGSQVRDAANQNNPANYLESGTGWNNASATGPYLLPQPPATGNDRLLAITTPELLTPVEYRAAREILSLLAAYKSASVCACYPWADFSDGFSNPNSTYGRLPFLGATPENWGSGGIPLVPAWLKNNLWSWPFFYTLSNSGALRLNGVSGYGVVLITTGPAQNASRPQGAPNNWQDAWWANYIEDSYNYDLGTWFNTPSSTKYARDRIYTIP